MFNSGNVFFDSGGSVLSGSGYVFSNSGSAFLDVSSGLLGGSGYVVQSGGSVLTGGWFNRSFSSRNFFLNSRSSADHVRLEVLNAFERWDKEKNHGGDRNQNSVLSDKSNQLHSLVRHEDCQNNKGNRNSPEQLILNNYSKFRVKIAFEALPQQNGREGRVDRQPPELKQAHQKARKNESASGAENARTDNRQRTPGCHAQHARYVIKEDKADCRRSRQSSQRNANAL